MSILGRNNQVKWDGKDVLSILSISKLKRILFQQESILFPPNFSFLGRYLGKLKKV